MADVTHSSLLGRLMEDAKTVVCESKSVTGERFLYACIRYLAVSSESSEERESMLAFLASRVPSFSALGEVLEQYISDAEVTLSDKTYFQLALRTAMNHLGPEESELSALSVLTVLFESPTAGLEKCLKSAAAGDSGTPSAEPAPAPRKRPAPRAKSSPAPSDSPKNAKKSLSELTKKVESMRQTLLGSIFGQDNAVNGFVNGYFRSELLAMTDKNRFRPRATFLFAGPPGIGKTFLSELAAQNLGLPFMRFDMSEYSDDEANLEFAGSDHVYKHGKPGNVTGFVAANPKCVLLFDEIEKAHRCVIHLFLQILDAGRLRDNYTDEEVSFTDTIVIFTTNAGRQLYEQSDSGDFSGVSRQVILKALQKDTNPNTGVPYFPAAICSRFASGNVVMLNRITANGLLTIAKREVERHAKNFAESFGIRTEIDDSVYSALLFAEGGSADARTVRSRAESFFDDELFELFRLVNSEKSRRRIDEIRTIRIVTDTSGSETKIRELFSGTDTPNVLVFASKEVADRCGEQCGDCRILSAQSVGNAVAILRNHDVGLILLDVSFGRKDGISDYLNTEDIDSASRDFFRMTRERFRDIPTYLLRTPENRLSAEELNSFLRQGARGEISLSDGEASFGDELHRISETLHQQKSMDYLAAANKVISYETGQKISKDGRVAEICLFDFRMITAVDAEDSGNLLGAASRPDVHFDQVIGAEDAKKELRYFVQYLRNPKKYLDTGVRAPRGVILYGPPGTGKTMLAKAMACESDVTFLAAQGNQFLQKYIGEGKEMVHELFRVARKYAPAILFVDEIDAIARERRGGEHSTANGEDVLTAFLAEMDGFATDSAKPVFVLAATNYEVEPGRDKSLDPALLRRFDRKICIDLPNREERMRYLKMKMSANKAFEVTDAELKNLAVRSTGMSLAELESALEMALRIAIRAENFRVTDAVMEEAFETYNSGSEKKWDPALLERTARHEAGHAYLCWKSGETPSYVTVVARGSHGGYMQHDDREGKRLFTREELLSRIRTSLGGRAAELVFYGAEEGLSTGASSDLSSATAMARQTICAYGMDERFGLAVIDRETAQNGPLAEEVRKAVNGILTSEMEKAVAQISAGRAAVDALTEALLSRNHLTGSEISAIFTANA